MALFEIKNLTYKVNDNYFFNNFNLEIEEKKFISIIAPNRSGKTMLTKIISAIIPTYEDNCILDGIILSKETVLNYITKIGVASNEFNSPFLFSSVREELSYPLENLGYSESKIDRIISKISEEFDIEDILDCDIENLSKSLQNKLLIIIALVHKPKLLVLDDIFNDMNKDDQDFILEKLIEFKNKDLTILNITSKLDSIYKSDKVYVMDNFKIEQEGEVEDILKMDSYLNKIGLEIPNIVDLSLKLKHYELLDRIYFNIEELEDNLWN